MALLAGQVVVVCGVGPGLGRSIALASAHAGADVVLAARTASRLDEVAKEVTALGRRGIAVPTDVTDGEAAARLTPPPSSAVGTTASAPSVATSPIAVRLLPITPLPPVGSPATPDSGRMIIRSCRRTEPEAHCAE